MPTQANYDHIKNELLHAKQKILELEKKIEEYKKIKSITFQEKIENINYSIENISPDPQLFCDVNR